MPVHTLARARTRAAGGDTPFAGVADGWAVG